MRRGAAVPLIALLFAIAPACSGAAPTDLLTPGSSGTSDSGADTGKQGGSDAGSKDGTAPFDSGNPVTEAGVPETGVKETGGGPQGPQVLCPQNGQPSTCPSGDFCCVTGDPQLGPQTDTCDPSGATCAGTTVHCASTADCPANEVCCGTLLVNGNSNMYTDVSCAKDCTGQNNVQFCDPQVNDCPNNGTCSGSQLLTGYNVCH